MKEWNKEMEKDAKCDADPEETKIPASNVLAENRAFLGEVNQGMAETQCPFRELCSRHESKIHSYLPQIEGSLQDHKYCVAAFHTTSN